MPPLFQGCAPERRCTAPHHIPARPSQRASTARQLPQFADCKLTLHFTRPLAVYLPAKCPPAFLPLARHWMCQACTAIRRDIRRVHFTTCSCSQSLQLARDCQSCVVSVRALGTLSHCGIKLCSATWLTSVGLQACSSVPQRPIPSISASQRLASLRADGDVDLMCGGFDEHVEGGLSIRH